MRNQKRTPTPEQVDRERLVLDLRRAGATFDDIATQAGYADPSGAWQAYRRAIGRTLTEAHADEQRELEAARLDSLQQAIWDRAIAGDLPAVNGVLRIMERRARLLGLDAPARSQVHHEHADADGIDAEVARLIALLEQN